MKNKLAIFSGTSTLNLFVYSIAGCFIISLLLTKVLSPYKGGIPMSTDLHEVVFYLYFFTVVLYLGFACWLRMHHRPVFKIIIIPVLLFITLFIGVAVNNWILTPWIMSTPLLSAYIRNWVFNMQWFLPFSISLVAPVLFYLEQLFFKWVRAGVSE